MLKSTIATCVLLAGLGSFPALADDTVKVDQHFALERVVELDVTPMGLVLEFGSPITSVNISHMSEIVFSGIDGALCNAQANCSDRPQPTKLFLRKIQPIDFEDQEPSPDGTSMLYVNTVSGLYRFQLTPLSIKPDYTKIQIEENFPDSVSPSSILQ